MAISVILCALLLHAAVAFGVRPHRELLSSTLPCSTTPIKADNNNLTNPNYRPPGYYDSLFVPGEDFPGLLDAYLRQNPSIKIDKNNKTQVVELITGLHTLKVTPLCPQNLSLPPGWQDFLEPVIAENYGIISGKPAPEGRFLYMVSLRDNLMQQHFCGGTLIAPNTVLTAAHCFFDDSTGQQDSFLVNPQVAVGRYFRNTDTNGSFVTQAVETVIHPDFHFSHNFTYDVALLRLPEPVYQFPVVTLNSAQGGAYSAISPGQNVTILGWGLTETGLAQTLREGTVPLVPRATCSEISAFRKAQAPITSTMVCAGQQLPPSGQVWPALPPVDACQGDSGGPMIAQGSSASGDVQLGIVSFGIGCAQPGVPGVYTDVVSVKDFIDSTVEQFSTHLSPSPAPTSSSVPSLASLLQGGNEIQARSGYNG